MIVCYELRVTSFMYVLDKSQAMQGHTAKHKKNSTKIKNNNDDNCTVQIGETSPVHFPFFSRHYIHILYLSLYTFKQNLLSSYKSYRFSCLLKLYLCLSQGGQTFVFHWARNIFPLDQETKNPLMSLFLKSWQFFYFNNSYSEMTSYCNIGIDLNINLI